MRKGTRLVDCRQIEAQSPNKWRGESSHIFEFKRIVSIMRSIYTRWMILTRHMRWKMRAAVAFWWVFTNDSERTNMALRKGSMASENICIDAVQNSTTRMVSNGIIS